MGNKERLLLAKIRSTLHDLLSETYTLEFAGADEGSQQFLDVSVEVLEQNMTLLLRMLNE